MYNDMTTISANAVINPYDKYVYNSRPHRWRSTYPRCSIIQHRDTYYIIVYRYLNTTKERIPCAVLTMTNNIPTSVRAVTRPVRIYFISMKRCQEKKNPRKVYII